MQAELGGPRAGLNPADVRALQYRSGVLVAPGMELLDEQDRVIRDLGDEIDEWVVDHANYADVHGTVTFTTTTKLGWGRERVRPYLVLSHPDHGSAKFYEGVYTLVSPETIVADRFDAAGNEVVLYSVTGADKMHLLQDPVGYSWVAPAGAGILAEVRRLLAASGAGGQVVLDPAREADTLPKAMVWPFIVPSGATASSELADFPTFVKIANELLKKVTYRGLYMDEDGAYRSEPYVEPRDRDAEWTLDAQDTLEGIVAPERTEVLDTWRAPNVWILVRSNMEVTPLDGNGIARYENLADGPTSINNLGRRRVVAERVDADNQADLESLLMQRVRADMTLSAVIRVTTTGPFPLLGHFDQMLSRDTSLGVERRVQVRSWSQGSNGTGATLELETI